MSPRKPTDQELKREMILDAARNLFVEKGYSQVSMRQIAKTLQCSHGAIYYHFKNKAELFYALVTLDFSMLDRTLDDILEQPISDKQKLERVLIGYIQFGLEHQSHYEIMFLIKDEEVRNYLQEGPNTSYYKFAQALNDLSDQTLSVQEIWSIFLSLHGFVSHYCRSGQTFEDTETAARHHVHFIMKLLND